MAYENLGKVITLPAGTDLSSSQYCFVKVNNLGQVVLPTDGGDAIGVLQNNPTSGQAAQIMVGNGVTKVVVATPDASHNPSAGDYVSTDAAGHGSSNDTGDRRLGIWLQAATAEGQIGSILFQKEGATA